MPDAPPGGHEEHSSIHYACAGVVPDGGVEDGGVEQQGESESRVLDSDFDGDGGVPGVANASEMLNLTCALLRAGYSKEDLRLLWGENFLRVMRQVQAENREVKKR